MQRFFDWVAAVGLWALSVKLVGDLATWALKGGNTIFVDTLITLAWAIVAAIAVPIVMRKIGKRKALPNTERAVS